MVLKESFRMQNHLSFLAEQALGFLSDSANVMEIKEEHLKSRSNPNAKDETIVQQKNNDMIPNSVIELYLDFLLEQEKLLMAIGKAKAKAGFDLDAAIAMNKEKHLAIMRIKPLVSMKASENTGEGKDYMINVDGNQTPYVYSVKTTKTIDYDRNMVKGIVKRLQKETDDVSTRIDQLNVTLEVDYLPKYAIGDSFEDAYEQFVG